MTSEERIAEIKAALANYEELCRRSRAQEACEHGAEADYCVCCETDRSSARASFRAHIAWLIAQLEASRRETWLEAAEFVEGVKEVKPHPVLLGLNRQETTDGFEKLRDDELAMLKGIAAALRRKAEE